MNEPIKTHIELAEIKEWLRQCENGIDPIVAFSRDNNVMLQRAYDERGKALSYISQRIHDLFDQSLELI